MSEKVKIIIEVDSKTGVANMKQFGTSGDKVTDGMKRQEKAAKSLTGSLKSVVAVVGALAGVHGIKGLASSFLDASRMTENYQVRLKVLLGSVEEGNRLFKEMADYAGRVPFEYHEIMGAATQLSGVMRGGVEEIKQWMPLIGDLAAASGLSIQQTTEQVIRMYSAGAGAADLFRERGITAMLGFQAGVSYSAEETKQRLMDAWNAAGSQFRGATESMAGTWDGMLSMISDKWFQVRNLVMGAGVYDELKKQLDSVNSKFGLWIQQNETLINQKVPKYIDGTSKALNKIWGIISYDPAIIEWGLVGLAIGGKKGAVVIGGLAHMKTWAENLVTAFSLAAQGVVDLSEIATANFKELEALANRTGPFFRGKIPARPKAGTPTSPGVIFHPEVESYQQTTDTLLGLSQLRTDQMLELEYLRADLFNEMHGETATRNIELNQYEHDYALQLVQDRIYQELALEERLASQKMMIRQAGLNFLSASGEAMINITMKQGKAQFAIQKAWQVGMAVMAAFLASNLAAAHPPGPPETLPLAAAVLKHGLLGAAAIAAASIGQMAAGGGSAGGGGGTIATPTYPAYTPGYYGDQQKGTLTINIQGDMIGDEGYIEMLAEKISDAVENRDVILVASNAKYADTVF